MHLQKYFRIVTIHIHLQIINMKFVKMFKNILHINLFDVFVYIVIWREARNYEFTDVVRQVF